VRKRPPSAAMSLFSYLDGLVCTMGALILLLLLTAQHVRDQVLEEHQSASSPSTALLIPEEIPLKLPEPEVMEPIPLPGPSDAEIEARNREIARLQAENEEKLSRHQETAKARFEEWRQKLRSLDQMNDTLADELKQSQSRVASTQTTVAKLSEEAAQLQAMMSQTGAKANLVEQTEEDFKKLAEELLRQREESLKKLEAAKVQKALRNPVFEIEARESHSGTTRRPILIECTADSVIFCSEGIRISAETLGEFTPEFNPLLAGTEALMKYWKQVDSSQHPNRPAPYVLMIVRPGGTVGFYVARTYLEKLGSDFGYELVTATAEFKWPQTDPQAVEACQTAINEMLNRSRPQVRGFGSGFGRSNSGGGTEGGGNRTGGGNGASSRFGSEGIVGENGEFNLAEVDQLRNSRPSDSINMLGPEWSKPQQRRLGTVPQGSGNQGSGHPGTGSPGTGSQGFNGSGARDQGFGNTGETDSNGTPGSGNMGSGNMGSGNVGDVNPGGEPTLLREIDEQMRSGQNSGIQMNPAPSGAPPGWNRSRGVPPAPDSTPNSPRISPRQLPPPPLTQSPSNPGKWKDDGGVQRKWGQGQSNGAIGIERAVTIHLKTDRFEISKGPQSGIPLEMTRHEFQDLVAALIDNHARTWGSPPANYFWRPTFEIKIHPGGNVHYPQLKELMEYWGLSYKIDFVSE